jgi:hypothetical protein
MSSPTFCYFIVTCGAAYRSQGLSEKVVGGPRTRTIAVDDAGNRQPSKRKSAGRIDGMIALAMAVGVAPLTTKQINISTLIV